MSSDLVAETLRRLAGRQLTPFDVDLLNRLENGVARAVVAGRRNAQGSARQRDRRQFAPFDARRLSLLGVSERVRSGDRRRAVGAYVPKRIHAATAAGGPGRLLGDARTHSQFARSFASRVEPLRQMDDDALRQVRRYMQENLPPDLPPATPSPARLRPERTPPASA